MVDLSVIIVSYNTCRLLSDCLASVNTSSSRLNVETYVVDNDSRDDSCHMVERTFPHVRLIRNATNVGFAAANNQALEQATGRYVLLLNSDTVVRPEALDTLVRFMDDHERAGYCGPRLVNGDGSHQPSARRFPTVLSGTFAITGLARRRPSSRHCLDLHAIHGDDRPFRADWLTGACLLVRRKAIADVGLLDDRFFMYFEETEWCRRLTRAGWEGWYVPEAEVVHFGGQSVSNSPARGPFGGDHPTYWVSSRRRYMRLAHGWAAMVLSELLDIGLHALIWARHAWRPAKKNQEKASMAAQRMRFLLVRRGPRRI